MTHEQHHLRHRELHRAVHELVADWIAHHLCQHADEIATTLTAGASLAVHDVEIAALSARLLDRPIRDLLAWSGVQAVNPAPLPGELHVERSSAAHEACDMACAERFKAGRPCRHLRTAEEWLRTR